MLSTSSCVDDYFTRMIEQVESGQVFLWTWELGQGYLERPAPKRKH